MPPGWHSEADVPIVPMIVWGAQRIWTKDHPRQIGRNKVPITVRVGAPLRATEDIARHRRRAARVDDQRCCTRCSRATRTRPGVLGAAPAGRRGTDLGRGGSDRRRRAAAKAAGRIPRQVTQGAVGTETTAWQSRSIGWESGSFRRSLR